MKVTNKKIENIKKLSKSGLSYSKISKKLDVDIQIVMYYLNEKYRKRVINTSKNYQKKNKKKVNEYMKNYMKKKYAEDKEYRERRLKDEIQRRNTRKEKNKENKGHPYKKGGRR